MKGIKKTFISAGLALTLLAPLAANAQEKSLKEKCEEIAYSADKGLIENKAVGIKESGEDVAFHFDFYPKRDISKWQVIVEFYDHLYNRPLIRVLDIDFDGTVEKISYPPYNTEFGWYGPKVLPEKEVKEIEQLYKDAINYFWKSKNIEGKVKLHKHITKLKNKDTSKIVNDARMKSERSTILNGRNQ